MTDILSKVDNWFLIIAVVVLGSWFVWSMRRIFQNLENSINDLRKTMEKLFDADKAFEQRLSTLEGEHKALACRN